MSAAEGGATSGNVLEYDSSESPILRARRWKNTVGMQKAESQSIPQVLQNSAQQWSVTEDALIVDWAREADIRALKDAVAQRNSEKISEALARVTEGHRPAMVLIAEQVLRELRAVEPSKE